MRTALWVFLNVPIMAVFAPAAHADTVYTYVGNSYTDCTGTYCSGPNALSITFATTLTGSALDNLNNQNIGPNISSYSFTDMMGLNLSCIDFFPPGFPFNPCSSLWFVTTDANGNILSWQLGEGRSQGPYPDPNPPPPPPGGCTFQTVNGPAVLPCEVGVGSTITYSQFAGSSGSSFFSRDQSQMATDQNTVYCLLPFCGYNSIVDTTVYNYGSNTQAPGTWTCSTCDALGPSSLPEPSTSRLFMLGGSGLGFLMRKRKGGRRALPNHLVGLLVMTEKMGSTAGDVPHRERL